MKSLMRCLSLSLAVAGAFFALPSRADAPKKYVTYIESKGAQWVLLDYTPTASTRIEADVAIVDRTKTSTIYCSRDGATTDTFTMFYIMNKGLRCDYQTNGSELSGKPADSNRHLIAFENGLAWIDGMSVLSGSAKSFTPGNKMTLFASYSNAKTEEPNPNTNYAYIKMYGFKAYEDGQLVLDLYPCETEEGKVGLWDDIHRQLYLSGSTTAFISSGEETEGPRAVFKVSGEPEKIGTPDPNYGFVDGLVPGASYDFTCPAVWTNETSDAAATCVGWQLRAKDGSVLREGKETSLKLEYAESMCSNTLVWCWKRDYKVAVQTVGSGTATGSGWYAEGATAAIAGTPGDGNIFDRWTSAALPGGKAFGRNPALTVTQPMTLTANFAAKGVTKTWTGNGATALASLDANWSEGTAPKAGDDIVFSSGSKACTWDLDVTLGSWTQDGYTGTVTIQTVYDPSGFACLAIDGNVVLRSGTWTHVANTAINRTYRLYASVGGDFELSGTGAISATGCGYKRQYLLNGGQDKADQYRGGTYGGYGCWNGDAQHPSVYGSVPYGSIAAPEDPGSGTTGSDERAGGGAIRLDVAGALTQNGKIDADTKIYDYYGGSGGSVYVRAGSIAGTGTITADARWKTGDYSSGSGGRIAVVLTKAGSTFAAYDVLNLCSSRAKFTGGTAAKTRAGAAGTIYAETPSDAPGKGWLIFKESGNYTHTDRALCNGWPYATGVTASAQFARVTVTNGASVVVPSGYTFDLGKTELVSAGAATVRNGLRLEGGTVAFPSENVTLDCWLYSTKDAFKGLQGKNFTLSAPGYAQFATVDHTLPGNWTIAEGATVFAGKAATGGIKLSVPGDLTVNGTITHDGPYDSNPDVLTLAVAGDLTVGATGMIDVLGKGYSKGRDRTGARPGGQGGSHGGWGLNWNNTETRSSIVPYGSIYRPTTAGAGGVYSPGGGILIATVAGALRNDGIIRADSATDSNYYRGAGGSLDLTVGSLSGSGRITADAPVSEIHSASGGGRVAIRLTDAAADFSTYTGRISASGEYASDNNGKMGGAGSVYLRTAAQGESAGTLVVANWDTTHTIKKYGWTIIGGGNVEGDVFGDVLIGNKAKLVVMDDSTMTVSGVLSNGCFFAAQPGSSVVFAGAGASRVYGNFDFVNVSAAVPGKQIVFDDNAVIKVSGEAAFAGAADDNLTLCAASADGTWSLKGSNLSLTGVALRGCQVDGPLTVMNGKDLGGNSANITFVTVTPGELLTWSGAADAAWGNAANWDKGRTPIETDKIRIPAGATAYPTLAGDVAVAELTVESGARLSLNGKTMTVAGACTQAGEVVANGGTLAVAGDVTLSGACGSDDLTLRATGAAQTLALGTANLRQLSLSGAAATVSGAITCSTFAAGDGAAACDVAFADGASVVAGHFAFAGATATTNGVLRCATAGGTWRLNASTYAVSGVAVSGSDAREGVLIVPTDCKDNGDNQNWLFVDNRAHWQGTTSDFHTPGNWSTGAVPDADTDIVVEGEQELVVSAAAAVRSLSVANGARLTVNAAFAVGASMTIEKNATVTWNVPGTIGGNLVMLDGAKLTHTANASTEACKIDLAVGGAMQVAAGAKVDVRGRGYATNRGPGAPSSAYGPASHGGRSSYKEAYGSVLCPTNCGSGGQYSSAYSFAGGGAVKLTVGGVLTVNGAIDADGDTTDYYAGSGGSIWLRAAQLAGSGAIHANGGSCYQYGMGVGGRVAVYLTGATSFDAYAGTLTAYSGYKVDAGGGMAGSGDSSPGTVYRETAADAPRAGMLTIANDSSNTTPRDLANYCVDLPVAQYGVEKEVKDVTVIIKSWGALRLTADLKIRDIVISAPLQTYGYPEKTLVNLQLNGHCLQTQVKHHPVCTADGADESRQISTGEGGQILWKNPGLVLIIR